ncbi:MAG: NUDIX domain-containing protein [Polyangiaceae bacterium]|nr:NUDIX domain-containing protein [Polyangiaceae bacterium]
MKGKQGAIFTLIDGKGAYLFQHRTADAPQYPNQWGFFGGRVEDNESPEKAVWREAIEELNLPKHQLTELHLLGRFPIHENAETITFSFFIAPLLISAEHLDNEQREGQGWGFFSAQQWRELNHVEHDHVFMKALRAATEDGCLRQISERARSVHD